MNRPTCEACGHPVHQHTAVGCLHISGCRCMEVHGLFRACRCVTTDRGTDTLGCDLHEDGPE